MFVLLGWLLCLVGSSHFTPLLYALAYILYLSVSLTNSLNMLCDFKRGCESANYLWGLLLGVWSLHVIGSGLREVGRCSEPKHSPMVHSSSASPAWQMCSCPRGSKTGRGWWGGNWIFLCNFCQSTWTLKNLASKHHNHFICYPSQPASVKFKFVH